ncbi:hypothetical protein ABBQ38_001586 [Trebouxia sp. C0009 RCD-2024]
MELASEGCSYNYVVSAHKPTAVRHSVVGNFTSSSDLNLIISKVTRVEIYTLTPEGLKDVADVPIYGRIASLELFRPPGEKKDLLFFTTERYKFCVLYWDAENQLQTRASGNLADRTGRPVEHGQIGIVDPDCRVIGVQMYDGLLKVIPMDSMGFQEAFNIRVDQLQVLSMEFLYDCPRPTVALLYQDNKDARHLRTYEISIKDKEFVEGPFSQNNLDPGVSMIIPVPGPTGGLVVVGESVIMYVRKKRSADDQAVKSIQVQATIVKAVGRVDPDGSRYLLGDTLGNLHMLVLSHDSQRVVGLKLEALGRISAPSSLSYLDSGVVFVGSLYGDSQLIRLHPEAVDPTQPSNFVEVMDVWTNLGPIIDLAVVDLERQGQGQVVTCSGKGPDSSLRIVRNGIGMIEQAAVELAGIKGIWNLQNSSSASFDTYLVLAFVGETRILEINAEDELDEAEIEGFDAEQQTLYCGNMVGDLLVQVTAGGVRLLSAPTGALLDQWLPPPGLQINVASASPSQLLVATGHGNIAYLEVEEGKLKQVGHHKLDTEVACLDITPIGEDSGRAALAAVGTWQQQLLLFDLPALQPLLSQDLGEVIPRSLLFAQFEGVPHLLCALGDGHLFTFHVDPPTGELSEKKKLSLGSKPMTLKTFHSNGVAHVFAASDRPTVIYSSNKKLLYSNVNENEVNLMTSFNSSSFPDSLAIAKESGLTIGSIDEIQKLHIRAVPLGEQARRLAHQDSSHTFLVTTSSEPSGSGVSQEQIRLVDDQTFETVDVLPLHHYEMACSCASLTLADDPNPYYVVGTAYAIPDEQEPTKGRILVLESKPGKHKLHLVFEKDTRGAVYTISGFQGKLIAGINSRVQLYDWQLQKDSSRGLVAGAGQSGLVLALYLACRGDFIVVGDLMKSIYLLMYKAEEGVLEIRAKDFHSNYMTAVDILDDDTYLGAEINYNLFTVRKNSDAASDEDRNRLEVVGEYHLGDMVNRFQRGSLVMQLPDSETARIPTLLFGTILGIIGVIASIPREQYQFLEKLQDCMRQAVNGVGGLSHEEWRSFSSDRKKGVCKNFIDGDLIEQFVDLKRDTMQWVVDRMGNGTTVEELSKTVEELSRLH